MCKMKLLSWNGSENLVASIFCCTFAPSIAKDTRKRGCGEEVGNRLRTA